MGLFGGLGQQVSEIGGTFGVLMKLLLYAVPLGIFLLGIAYFVWRKKRWNLKVEIKIPRGINQLREGEELNPEEITGIINAEWGQGGYNARRGVCFIKRKKRKSVPMKPFDIKRFVQGAGILTVVQTGAESYSPVLPESFLQMYDDKTGEEAVLLKARMDNAESKAWRSQFEREAKNTYSIIGLLAMYKDYLGWGLILFVNFVGFAILYGKIT